MNLIHLPRTSLLAGILLLLPAHAQKPAKPAKPTGTAETREPKVVSTSWTKGVVCYSPHVQRYWPEKDEDMGLVVILQRSDRGEAWIHTNDFVLAFEGSDRHIPRRPCLGISYGMKSSTDTPRWAILGTLSRHYLKSEDTHFALLFGAPKDVSTFNLRVARPHQAILVPPLPQNPEAPQKPPG